ncbi:nucleotide pyrophosphohydrolase [Klebsiella oxytoca]|uniref:Nucleotide pyrophosphohydrolase n=1 Tax=Klebsiella oxytoca TaxID=571 RepID=A0A6N3EBH3_KLEOX|nr:nucleotide pyrophosphohydrolase [Klebsiella oxytoca]MBZ7548450.1 nucleotide pyrophosphohydrolase [Klebsiella oxytoca]HDX8701823.1 nucleotide pyrophosphohydrolase [Klebsiella oxytoca]HEC2064725.1 nucleotide pyrophosphohydrolase [Klebsiella oxytoca]HED4267729.1 nucleotide pyrophosphohydrolase [Klebsiella oxytoca]HEJ7643555.1 nucleotide pyrophosphohydrolase [Klebsiella oxytoca]
MKTNELIQIQNDLANFASERDWDKFHSPKNLSMAMSVEAGELVEIFQWLTDEESRNLTMKQKVRAEEEIADVFLYLLRIADKLNIDVVQVAKNKLATNAAKYPIEACYGNAKKYTDL